MYTGYLRLKSGKVQTKQVRITEKTAENDVKILFIDGVSDEILDENFGAGIDFKVSAESYMTNFRYSPYWCKPAFGKADFSDMPDETQGLIYQKKGGAFGVILPLVTENYKCVLCGNDSGGITAKLYSWAQMTDCRAAAFVRAEGENPFILLKNCINAALCELNNGCRSIEERVYPELFEYLGWCSWDAMEIRVNEADLLKKCDEFKQKNIPVRWMILDDMWAEIRDFYGKTYDGRGEMISLMHASKLWSFHADPKRFPNGLKGAIQKIKDKGLKVGMWHPTTGYWAGIDPHGEAFKEYKDCLIQSKNGRFVHDWHQDKAFLFYDRLHTYFKSCGADFVKIDNQSGLIPNYYKNLTSVGNAAREYHAGMEDSVEKNFKGNVINCMGMASEDMWNRKNSAISRCSDDFQPENAAWFLKHIVSCAYNGLIQGGLYFCDWDMWWTDDGQAEKNSLLRAISGGPIYISDMLERSRKEILDPLILSDGKILRCDRPAVPTADCLTRDPLESENLFKLQNKCGAHGVMAVFNLNKEGKAVGGTVSPSEVFGLKGEGFAVYEHFSKTLKIVNKNEAFSLSLPTANDYKLYIFAPISDGFAAIGRTDKFISPKTIKSVNGREVTLFEDGEYAVVEDGHLVFKKQ